MATTLSFLLFPLSARVKENHVIIFIDKYKSQTPYERIGLAAAALLSCTELNVQVKKELYLSPMMQDLFTIVKN